MINVIHIAFSDPILKINEIFNRRQDVFIAENRYIGGHVQVEFVVHLGPPHV